MPKARFRVTINGFRVVSETWDDALEWDGKRDEVFISCSVKGATGDGQVIFSSQPTTPVMGDVNNLNGRVLAGTASPLGGLRTGDSFPTATPQIRTIPLDPARDYPPFAVWEGDLEQGGNVVFITPAIWEWDPGGNLFEGWLQWHKNTDAAFGQKAKEIYAGNWPAIGWIFDAVSLGIQTAATLTAGGPIGSSGSRPIGMVKDPADASGRTFVFNPYVLPLTYDRAQALVARSEFGVPGLISVRYGEDPYWRGDYILYLQVEQVGAADNGWRHVGHANGVRALAGANGRLFCVTGDNVLWTREALSQDIAWSAIGHANGVTAMTALNGKLYSTTSDNGLHVREPFPFDVVWTRIGHANGVVGLAGAASRLFCATNDNTLWARDPVNQDVNWSALGQAGGVTTLAGEANALLGTAQNQILRRGLNPQDPWQPIDNAPPSGVTGLAVVDGALWATTADNRLWRREL
jgi:hypothetical protein